MQSPKETQIVWFLLRFGVAFTFLYAAMSAFVNPVPWLSYFPDIIRSNFSDMTLLLTWGVGELLLGIWIISGYRIFIPSIAASGFLLGIFIFHFNSMPITFRNVAILSTAISLAIMSNPHYHFRLSHKNHEVEEIHEIKTAQAIPVPTTPPTATPPPAPEILTPKIQVMPTQKIAATLPPQPVALSISETPVASTPTPTPPTTLPPLEIPKPPQSA